jgi:crotonobetainyl-CoA:carnitine CoA-transferase CaiB-like acyl-CoA transferase
LEDVDELDAIVRKAMGEKTQSEWMELFAGEFDVGADPFLTPAEFLAMADMVDNGRVVEIDDPEVGRSTQVGPLALLERSPSTIGVRATGAGRHAVEHEEWLTDERFATAESRAQHDNELTDALVEIFTAKDAGDWQVHLLDRGVPATCADEQTFEEFVVENVPHEPMTHPAFGDYWRRAPTIRFSSCEPVRPSGAPSLGEHTLSVLADLGYSEEECRELIGCGALKAAEEPAS